MKLSIQTLLSSSIFVFGIGLAYGLGSLGGNLLRQQILTLPMPSLKQAEPHKTAPVTDQTLPETEFTIIMTRNIFNAQRAKVETPVAGPAEPTAAPTLNLSLVGTMIYRKISFAFLSQKGKEEDYIVFSKGDCFEPQKLERVDTCEPQHVKISHISNREVVLIYQNKEQTLVMAVAETPHFDPLDTTQKPKAPAVSKPEEIKR